MNAKIYLNVPFAEKEEAKSYGARWDPQLKKWYYKGPVSRFANFGRWIAEGREQTIIVYENISILEAKRACYRCGKQTRIIGFGIWDHSSRMNLLKIHNVYFDPALALDWDMSYCTNDWAYTQYCHHVEDITLPNAKDMYAEYAELYGL